MPNADLKPNQKVLDELEFEVRCWQDDGASDYAELALRLFYIAHGVLNRPGIVGGSNS